MALSWLEMAYGEPGSTGAAWCYLLPMYGAQVCSLRLEGRAHSESVQRRRPPPHHRSLRKSCCQPRIEEAAL
jgi:hypothetical protein